MPPLSTHRMDLMNTNNTPHPAHSRGAGLRSVALLHAGTDNPELRAAYTAATAAAEDYFRTTGGAERLHTHHMVENRAPGR